MENKVINFHIIRHGQTLFNAMGRTQGWADSLLTHPGVEEVKSAGRGLGHIDFQSIYTSDLSRARQTTSLILGENKHENPSPIEDERIREISFGMFEGEYSDRLRDWTAKELGYDSVDDYLEVQGAYMKMVDLVAKKDEFKVAESSEEVFSRIKDFFEDIIPRELKNGSKDVLIVSHGMTINYMVFLIKDLIEGHYLPNVSRTLVVYKNGKLSVESIGDTSHIKEPNS